MLTCKILYFYYRAKSFASLTENIVLFIDEVYFDLYRSSIILTFDNNNFHTLRHEWHYGNGCL